MRAVESDSVKSARKAIKDKLHKPFKEHQKLVSELLLRQEKKKTECAWQV